MTTAVQAEPTDQELQQQARPIVSVIITTHNRAKLLKEAIESVLAVPQHDFTLHVLVVDDGSTDDTATLVAQYPVGYIRTSSIGMAQARNTGLHMAHGDFVTLLDDDDVWLPTNIAPQLAVFAQHPEYGAVHAQSQLVDYDKTPFGEPVPAGPLPSGWLFDELLTYWPQVGTIVTRIDVAREAGDMDPALTGDTDWDWLLRIARRYPIGRVELPVLLFRQRGGANEDLSWRRFPAMVTIFNRHTKTLGLRKRLRVQPILWRHRGWWASNFLDYARQHAAAGARTRAYRSLYYAFRCSLPHALLGCIRNWPLAAARPEKTSAQQNIG
ncbi:MAG: glycosyltransferase family 2 protein [Chloroflexi bacterium SZAS-1]|jgi:glycosyltransferase involved in cell wall biosynthesis|nr:glycosyltransferase family 2 protein [Chloroflexi bacterium SZAS-1]